MFSKIIYATLTLDCMFMRFQDVAGTPNANTLNSETRLDLGMRTVVTFLNHTHVL